MQPVARVAAPEPAVRGKCPESAKKTRLCVVSGRWRRAHYRRGRVSFAFALEKAAAHFATGELALAGGRTTSLSGGFGARAPRAGAVHRLTRGLDVSSLPEKVAAVALFGTLVRSGELAACGLAGIVGVSPGDNFCGASAWRSTRRTGVPKCQRVPISRERVAAAPLAWDPATPCSASAHDGAEGEQRELGHLEQLDPWRQPDDGDAE